MDEELEAQAPEHEAVPANAAELVAERVATAVAPDPMPRLSTSATARRPWSMTRCG